MIFAFILQASVMLFQMLSSNCFCFESLFYYGFAFCLHSLCFNMPLQVSVVHEFGMSFCGLSDEFHVRI